MNIYHSLVLAHHHSKRDAAGTEQVEDTLRGADPLPKWVLPHVNPALDEDADEGEGEGHARGEPEERRRRVVHPHVLLLQQELGEPPAEATKEAGGDDHDETSEGEGRRREDHHEHAGGDEGDDEDEPEGGLFEAEKEGEEEDEDEGGGLAHRVEGERDELEREVGEPDVERGRGGGGEGFLAGLKGMYSAIGLCVNASAQALTCSLSLSGCGPA